MPLTIPFNLNRRIFISTMYTNNHKIYLKKSNGVFLTLMVLMDLIGLSSFAQNKLSPDQAIAEGLKNNYSIRISAANAEIASTNVSPGQAGFLPQINLNLAEGNSLNNTKQNLSSGFIVDKKNVGSNNINSGISLNWTLFDGMKMFASYEKLKELEKLEQLKLKAEIESSIYAILLNYYETVKSKQMLKVLESSLKISMERIQIEETKFASGSSSKIDLLQAKLDANENRSQVFKVHNQLESQKIKLNQLLGRGSEIQFDVIDSIVPYDSIISLESIKSTYEQNNKSILIADKNTRISHLSLQEIKADRYPRIGFNANYNFSRTENQAGFILLNQNLGFNSGFTLSFNLFDGYKLNRTIQSSHLQIKASMLATEMSKSMVETEILTAFKALETQKALFNLEKDNFSMALENVRASMERYKVGNISAFQLKDAQKTYEGAYSRYINASFDVKEAELSLLKAGGKIIQ